MSSPKILAALLLLTTLSFCRPVSDFHRSDLLTLAMSSFPTNLDPRIGIDSASEDFHHLLFNGLLRKDASGRMVPDLCSHFERITPTLYRFYLRPGVYFHNGKRCSSRDVVYTYKTVMDGSIVTTKKATLGSVIAVRAIGEDKVDVELSEPFNGLLVNLNLGIIPEGSPPTFSSHPIGTGPYMLHSYTQDQEATLEANQKYFDGAPKLRYLRIRMIPDAVTRALELRKGTLDLVMGPAIVPPDQYLVLRNNPMLRTVLSPGNNYAYLGINMNDPILKNVKVRQAIAFCMNRKEIIDHLYHGAATEASGLLAPYNWGYEKEVPSFSYDPERAKRLLDEAGYTDPDGNGPQKRFVLTFKTSTNEFRRMLATLFQNDFDRVGIGLQVRAYEFGTFFSDINHGNFQLFMLMWIGESDPDLYRNIFATDGTRNRGKYSNPDVDLWLEKARTAKTEEEQTKYYSLVQKKVAEDCPYISLWHESNIAVFHKGLTGFVLTPDADIRVLKDVYWQ